jgi:hypothetical protein
MMFVARLDESRRVVKVCKGKNMLERLEMVMTLETMI